MEQRRICAVFDIDDTLYLERDYVRSGFEAVGYWAARWLQIDDFAKRCWNSFEAGRRKSVFDDVLRECDMEPSTELVSGLVEIYRTHSPSIALAADAFQALTAISCTASIAALSDGPVASQSRKVEALGLASLAAPIILTGLFGIDFHKPQLKGFEMIMQSLPQSKYLYVADNPLKDFTAPKQLGWVTVRIRRPQGLHFAADNPRVIPDLEMDDCSELPEFLTRL